jgi:hypothetical protein
MGRLILTADAVQCGQKKNAMKFLVTIKQTVNYVTNTTVLYIYWYFVMAACFGPSLDHPQASVHQ